MLGLAPAASAQDIFLNGVKVNGLTDQHFEGASVRFDDKGNVHLSIPDVRVHHDAQKTASRKEAPKLRRTYWLVASQTNPGATQYNVDVHVNGQFVTRLVSADARQLTVNVNKFLVPGNNTVVFTAIKDLGKARRSFAEADELTFFLGEGAASGHQITIDRTLVRYTRTAAEVDNDTATFTFLAE